MDKAYVCMKISEYPPTPPPGGNPDDYYILYERS